MSDYSEKGSNHYPPGALEALYDRYSAPLFAAILRWVTNRPRAEQILEQTFIGLAKNAPEGKSAVDNTFRRLLGMAFQTAAKLQALDVAARGDDRPRPALRSSYYPDETTERRPAYEPVSYRPDAPAGSSSYQPDFTASPRPGRNELRQAILELRKSPDSLHP